MRGLVLVGILLMFLSFVFLCGGVVIPSLTPSLDSLPPVRDALNALLCEPGEHIVGEQSVTNPLPGRTNYSMNVSCVDSAGRERDVQGTYITYMLVSFVVPFLLGLLLTIFGAARGTARLATRLSSSVFVVPAQMSSTPSGGGMTERLRNLKSAYDSGLITASEYEAKRREILDQG